MVGSGEEVACPTISNTILPSETHTEDDFPELVDDAMFYITVYVKVQQTPAEKYCLDFHKSLGGQVHVFCKCTTDPFPLIVTGRRKKDKKVCITPGCTGTEHYICL